MLIVLFNQQSYSLFLNVNVLEKHKHKHMNFEIGSCLNYSVEEHKCFPSCDSFLFVFIIHDHITWQVFKY